MFNEVRMEQNGRPDRTTKGNHMVKGGSTVAVTSSGNNRITVSNSGSVIVKGFFLIFAGTVEEVTT